MILFAYWENTPYAKEKGWELLFESGAVDFSAEELAALAKGEIVLRHRERDPGYDEVYAADSYFLNMAFADNDREKAKTMIAEHLAKRA